MWFFIQEKNSIMVDGHKELVLKCKPIKLIRTKNFLEEENSNSKRQKKGEKGYGTHIVVAGHPKDKLLKYEF